MMRRVDGQVLDVDTKYLFSDQFNTFPIPNVTKTGLRIFITDVEEILDDLRLGMGTCGYCDKCLPMEEVFCTCGHKLKALVPGSRLPQQGMETGVKSALNRCFPRR